MRLLRLYKSDSAMLSGTVVSRDNAFVKEVLTIIPKIIDNTECICIVDDDGKEKAIQFYKSVDEFDRVSHRVIIGQANKIHDKHDTLEIVIDNY